jgi:SAM-dependent methyltransferase
MPPTPDPAVWSPKQEAMRLWNADPCGGAIDGQTEGTAAFFREVDRQRYEAYAPWLGEAVGFGAGQSRRVLEVGCGMGTDLARFARHGATVFGVDLTPRHLAITRARLLNEDVIPRLVRGDAEHLPMGDGTVDLVYSFGVLHHTPDITKALDEIHRVLRPGGRLVLGLYHRHSMFYWLNTMLVAGVLHGRLWRDGRRRLMADIERHDHSDAMPLVNVYSRRETSRLLHRFSAVETTTHHLEASQFSYLAPLVRKIPRARLEHLGARWGWYVIAKATK